MVTVSGKALLTTENYRKSDKWMLDSCCSKHMCNNKAYFSNFVEREGVVQVGNKEVIPSYGVGTVPMTTMVNGKQHYVTLHDVLYTQDIMHNLISISQVRRKQFRVRIDDEPNNMTRGRMDLHHKPSGEVKMCGIETGEGLYEAVAQVFLDQAHVAKTTSMNVWHRRLGHASNELLQASVQHMHGVEGTNFVEAGECEACELGKSRRAPRKAMAYEERGAAKPLERVFSDLVGSMKHSSIGRSRYFVTLLDSYSGYSIARFLARKSETGDAVVEMVHELENLLNGSLQRLTSINRNTLKWMRTDGGGEYIGTEFQEWIKRRGIVHEITTTYSPESNGAAERLNRTLLDMARTMMIGMETQRKDLWAEAVHIASFLRNRLLSKSSRERKKPYEIIHGKRLRLDHLRTFGSRAYVHKRKEVRHWKFDSRALPGTLVGFCQGNAYRVLLDSENAVVESQDVKIVEDAGTSLPHDVYSDVIEFDLSDESVIFDDIVGNERQPAEESELELESLIPGTGNDGSESNLPADVDLDELTYYPGLRRSERTTAGKPPERLGYEVACMVTEQSKDGEVPWNYKDAVNRNDSATWKKAMEEEINSLNALNTWELVQLPPERKVVKTK